MDTSGVKAQALNESNIREVINTYGMS